MAWTESKAFRAWISGPMMQAAGTGYTGLDSDTVKAALFDNNVTPDRDAAVAETGYNTGTWTTAREITGGTNWPVGGRSLASKTFTSPAPGTVMFDAADLSAGGTVTLTDAYGCLVYDDSITGGTNAVADQGVAYFYFGGPQSVVSGSFTVVWSSNGLVRFES
ncbi:hypothetical protein [Streptomyces sp. NRRL S-455]|uniref:hypothetical protein n=1 Tax=Streptomyces sp. NRRL S-455 TaxID=1463908 RepID=UPI0004C0F8CB|nr:hypothetical protein [Streptomyces sp. NRRL S-455]